MDYLPKLLPSWHDLSYQEYVRLKTSREHAQLNPPDYGGVGLDININTDVGCRISKFFKSELPFASNKCALPFIPLKKAIKCSDPCLKSLEKEKLEFDKFCYKLNRVRARAVEKATFARLKSLEKDINAFNVSGDKDRGINISTPPGVVDLAESIPKRIVVPAFNVDYAGGTLAVCKYSDRQALIHPKCEDLNKLCITPLLDGQEQFFIPDLSRQMTFEFKNDPILQVEQTLDGFCVRQKNSFHLVNIANLDIYSKTTGKSSLYHIAASPFSPTDILSVYHKGKMKLRNMLTRKTVWSVSDYFYDDPYLMYPTWRCGFGSHPFSAMCMNEKKLYKFDFRQKDKPVEEIFKIENSSFHVGEELVSFKQWNKNSFQYFLTSAHHLILCDERYSQTPVMCWNHCLKNVPLYLEYGDFDSNVSIIVIGSQKSPQLASFVCSYQTDIQPISLSPPLLLSSASDCIESLKLHCYYIEDKISSRFSYPLSGVCIIPHKSENGFTVMQSTSVGDVYFQDFKHSPDATERTYHVSTGCILTPPEKILPAVNHLINQQNCEEVSFEDSSTDSTEVVEDDDDDDILCMNININKILIPEKKISANCMFCRLYNLADKELVLSETCPTCNMSSDESELFSKVFTSDSLLIGPTSDKAGSLDCDLEYLSQFSDKYSKRILSLWLDSDTINSS